MSKVAGHIIEIFGDYLRHIKNFRRNVKLLILSHILYSTAIGVFGVFFNVYLKKGGFQEDFIGVLSSIGTFTTVLVAIPAGIYVSKIGPKKAILYALPIIIASSAISSLTLIPAILITLAVLSGGANMMFNAAFNPCLTANSLPENRHYVFSLSWGLLNLSGVVGALAGGFVPDLLGDWFGFSEFVSLRVTLFSAGILAFSGFIPLLRLDEGIRCEPPKFPKWGLDFSDKESVRIFSKFVILNLIIGLGAGFSVPFMNIYFSSEFGLKPTIIGYIFSGAAAITGFATFASPLLVKKFGKLRAMIIPQTISLPFILLLAHSKAAWLAVAAFWIRGSLMNAANPVMNQIVMEQSKEEKRPLIQNLMSLSWNIAWASSVAVSGFIIKNRGYMIPFYITFFIYIFYVFTLYILLRGDVSLARPTKVETSD